MVRGPIIGGDADDYIVFDKVRTVRADRERQQRSADEARMEKLYVAEEYRLFLLTRQPDSSGDGRKAYVSARPFHAVPPELLDEMRRRGEPFDSPGAGLRITVSGDTLELSDDITSTKAALPLALLDKEVRDRLRPLAPDDPGWSRIFRDAAAAQAPIAVHRPLTFKKPGL